MKLNNIIKTANITAHGFAALKTLESMSNPNGVPAVLSSLSPAIMLGMGVSSYYAPVLPRGTVFNTAEEILAADIDVQIVTVLHYPEWDKVNGDKIVIVSRHQGTIEILQAMYPEAPVLSGNLNAADIDGLHVIGTLPPHLVACCRSYRAVTISDFDYAKDGDLQGLELQERIAISDPITVQIS